MLEAITSLDAQILFFIEENLRSPIATDLMTFWTTLGDGGALWIAAAVIMLFFKKTRRAGVLALGGLLINLLCVNCFLKPVVNRPRPWMVLDGFTPLVYNKSPSFPSGHTSGSFSFAAAACGCLEPKWVKVLIYAAATLMGLSRLYVGVHFPSDVVGGAVIGAACGLLAVWLYRKFLQKRFPLN